MQAVGNEGRPYRSHLHPACFSCKKRKSRCRTRDSSETCMICQAHGTECIFPSPDNCYEARAPTLPRKLPASARQPVQGRPSPLSPRSQFGPHCMQQPVPAEGSPIIFDPHVSTAAVGRQVTTPRGEDSRGEGLPNLMGIVAEAGDDSSHVISPAVADDNDILETYLSATPLARRRCLVRPNTISNRPMRPVRFNIVPRRPLGVTANQTLAASKCEVIEKYMEPDVDEYLNMFFAHANACFPIFDEVSFRSAYSTHKEKISPALLCNLYANSLIYWKNSPKLYTGRTPDIRFIWNQANEALHSELFLSPGISTVMSIIINVCGRPSTSMFGNGGMVGTAVALSNALGLNRDPSDWNISCLEKSLRIRIWWLVIHRAQCDVPLPTVNDICSENSLPQQRAAALVFISFVSLTDVLARYLEHVYGVSKNNSASTDLSTMDLEQLLINWEENLTDEIRLIVLRGAILEVSGAANFRLAYLAVKLLLRRIQLDLSKESGQTEDDVSSPFYMHAQRAAEDIAHLLHELSEIQFRGFWVPVHAFSLTSAAMFLLRSGLRLRHQNRNIPLRIAKDMINTLQAHRRNFDWDLADNCLSHCGELVEKIGMAEVDSDTSIPEFPEISEGLDIDPTVLEDLFFGISGFAEGLGFAEGIAL
ncbi:hypothetical protein N7492_006810 [Penicillium capsulatum]|uniref:Zn(2)-C6 fungal-type domain-containing protein n=1 Tax=Penicillium capsulatum TaxID=69766 RepID=A0A9W9LL84_9EURO|nr:hypothetical protein N7492_006810 [Penicillium capsulatum]KAJ6116645.1 hypothetical protein N7512_006370 [Penicillium capsulatum]